MDLLNAGRECLRFDSNRQLRPSARPQVGDKGRLEAVVGGRSGSSRSASPRASFELHVVAITSAAQNLPRLPLALEEVLAINLARRRRRCDGSGARKGNRGRALRQQARGP